MLGRSEFKQLLRWRMKVRKDLEAAEKARAKEQAAVRPPEPPRTASNSRIGTALCFQLTHRNGAR